MENTDLKLHIVYIHGDTAAELAGEADSNHYYLADEDKIKKCLAEHNSSYDDYKKIYELGDVNHTECFITTDEGIKFLKQYNQELYEDGYDKAEICIDTPIDEYEHNFSVEFASENEIRRMIEETKSPITLKGKDIWAIQNSEVNIGRMVYKNGDVINITHRMTAECLVFVKGEEVGYDNHPVIVNDDFYDDDAMEVSLCFNGTEHFNAKEYDYEFYRSEPTPLSSQVVKCHAIASEILLKDMDEAGIYIDRTEASTYDTTAFKEYQKNCKILKDDFLNTEKGLAFIKENAYKWGNVFEPNGLKICINYRYSDDYVILGDAFENTSMAQAVYGFGKEFYNKLKQAANLDYPKDDFKNFRKKIEYLRERKDTILDAFAHNELFVDDYNIVCTDIYKQMTAEPDGRAAELAPDNSCYDDYEDEQGRGR